MEPIDAWAEFHSLSAQKFDIVSSLLQDIDRRTAELRHERGMGEGADMSYIEGLSGTEKCQAQVFLRYREPLATNAIVLERLSKLFALFEMEEVPEEIKTWVIAHQVGSALSWLSQTDAAFQKHIPTEEISARVRKLFTDFESLAL